MPLEAFPSVSALLKFFDNSKNEEEKRNLKPSEVLSYVFDISFFKSDLELRDDQIVGFLEHIDDNLHFLVVERL